MKYTDEKIIKQSHSFKPLFLTMATILIIASMFAIIHAVAQSKTTPKINASTATPTKQQLQTNTTSQPITTYRPQCSSSQTGTWPNCQTIPCPIGQTGVYPNCQSVAPTYTQPTNTSCTPDGMTGSFADFDCTDSNGHSTTCTGNGASGLAYRLNCY